VSSTRYRTKMDALINIDVPDLNAAVDFYTSAVDLRLNRFISDGVAELSGASSTIYLLWHPEGTKPIPNRVARRHYSRHWTPVHLDFVMKDIDSAVQKAILVGARL
jgi:Glyoxalase-like domain